MKFDVAIIGSGLAGLSVALHLAETRRVAIISKRELLDGASNWAQGGIAAVLDSGDGYEAVATRRCDAAPAGAPRGAAGRPTAAGRGGHPPAPCYHPRHA